MPEERQIWEQVTRSLETRLSRSEFNTWFSQTTLQEFNPDLAIIGVPNKFVADWLRDRYQIQIKKSFQTVLDLTPQLLYSYDHPSHPSEEPDQILTEKTDDHPKHNLDLSMTFKGFTVGESNRFACLSALEVANSPAGQYNPLYIFSKSGLGKSHLLNAIGHHVFSKNPNFNVKYISSHTFTRDFTYSVRTSTFHNFQQAYSNIDVLLFDDVHLLTDRKKTQEEFLALFNSLNRAKKQIVITGDRPPTQITNADPRLISRLGWGLISELKAPDQKTKISIIKKKAREDNISIPDDVIFFLSKSNSNIKSLLKNVIQLETCASLNHRDIDISMAKSFIKDNNARNIGVEDIKAITIGYFNIPLSELNSNKKQRIYSYPRQIAMYLCRKYTELSYKEIGYSFGKKDHSTVLYAVKRIEKDKDKRKDIFNDLKKIENLIG